MFQVLLSALTHKDPFQTLCSATRCRTTSIEVQRTKWKSANVKKKFQARCDLLNLTKPNQDFTLIYDVDTDRKCKLYLSDKCAAPENRG